MNLATPAWRRVHEQVVAACSSPHAQRMYRSVLDAFVGWHQRSRPGPFDKLRVHQYRLSLERRHLAPASINQQLTVLRRLAQEGAEAGLLDGTIAQQIQRLPNVANRGTRAGQWLRREQARRILAAPDRSTRIGQRDYAILASILGCGLRRGEVSALTVARLLEVDGRWVIRNLRGKGARVRSIPIPGWVKDAMDVWVEATGLTAGRLFRAIRKNGTVWGAGLSEHSIWRLVDAYARRALTTHLAPHDLRRSFGRLCYDISHDLKEIQQLLGHASVVTTERYLGVAVDLIDPVNDKLRLS